LARLEGRKALPLLRQAQLVVGVEGDERGKVAAALAVHLQCGRGGNARNARQDRPQTRREAARDVAPAAARASRDSGASGRGAPGRQKAIDAAQ
jgi:hypothetical protein